MKQTTVYILLLLLTACQSKDRLDMALEYAGDNRKAVSMPIYNAATLNTIWTDHSPIPKSTG